MNRSNISLVGNTTQGENLGNGCTIYNGKINTNTLSYKTLSTTGTSIQLFSDDNTIYISGASGGGTTSPAGLDGSIQYNNNGSFGGFDYVKYNYGTVHFLETGDSGCMNGPLISAIADNVNSNVWNMAGSSTGNPDNFPTLNFVLYSGFTTTPTTFFTPLTLYHDTIQMCGKVCVNNQLNLSPLSVTLSTDNGDLIRYSGHSTCPDGLYYDDGTSQVKLDSPIASAGGSDGNMQYNNGGTLGGTCLNWDDSLNHIGWGTSARTDTMLSIMKDTSYDNWTPIMEFFGISYDGITELSQFRIDVQSPGNGSTLRTTSINGYRCGNLFNESLYINRNSTGNTVINNLYINENNINGFGTGCIIIGDSSAHVLDICSLLKLNPTTAPTYSTTGMVYYDSSANKLKFYNGTAWETISSSV